MSAGATVMQTSPAPAARAVTAKSGKKPLLPEMIIARMRELHHVPVVRNHGSRSGAHGPDGTIAPTLRRQFFTQLRDIRRAHREAQFIIVAAGERELAWRAPLRPLPRAPRRPGSPRRRALRHSRSRARAFQHRRAGRRKRRCRRSHSRARHLPSAMRGVGKRKRLRK